MSPNLFCEDFKLELQIGYASFGMNTLKNLNQTFIETSPFKSQVVDDFPMYLNYQLNMLFPVETIDFGFGFGYVSCGSRVGYSDYSGVYNYDQLVDAVNIAGLFGFDVFNINKLKLKLMFEAGYLFSDLELKEYIKIADTSISSSNSFNAEGFYFKPGIKLDYNFYNSFTFGANISYFIDLEPNFHLPNNSDAYLYNQKTHEKISPEWNGVRFGLFLSYYFKSKK